jgi:hypothetical protein
MDSRFIRAIAPQSKTAEHPALLAVVDATTFAATPDDGSPTLATGNTLRVMDQFMSPHPIRQPSGPHRYLPPAVRDLTQAAVQEAQRGNMAMGNFVHACDIGEVGGGDAAIPPIAQQSAVSPPTFAQSDPNPTPITPESHTLKSKGAPGRRFQQAGPPNGGPEPQSAPQIAAPARKSGRILASEQWLQEPIDVEGFQWLSDVGVLSPDRQWTYAANTSPAEQIANRAVLDAIVSARHHENPEAEIAAIVQIAEKAAWDAYKEGKHDQRGKHRLTGVDMTIDELLVKIPLFRWPVAGANGCYNIHCEHHNILNPDHPKREHQMIFERHMIDGECARVMGTASLLNARVHTLTASGFYNVYERHGAGRYETWRAFTNTFYSENAKRWHEATGDFWGDLWNAIQSRGPGRKSAIFFRQELFIYSR